MHTNPFIFLLVFLVLGLQLMVLYATAMEAAFDITPVSAPNLALCAGLSSIVFITIETEKRIRRHTGR